MLIRHYHYNAFIIESGNTKIAIDPGLNLSLTKLGSIIPKSEWNDVSHILITHGDPDHYWFADKLSAVSNAPIVCGKNLVKKVGEDIFLLNPRDKGIHYATRIGEVYPLEIGEVVELDGMKIEGLKAVHGPLVIRFFFGLGKIIESPGPAERIGLGSIGFKISLDGKMIINLGDTLLLREEWRELEGLKPDVLMIPIGGRVIPNTMNENDALEAVQLISPKMVLPCHFNNDFLFKRKANPANAEMFKEEVEKLRLRCCVLGHGDEISI